MARQITVVPNSVRKVCQVTGQTDRQCNTPAFNQTETGFGIFGTDLGSSFEHGGRLWFLFGDTWPTPQNRTVSDTDSVAWTTDTVPEPGIRLTFITDGNGRYRPPVLKDQQGQPLSTGSLEVPIAGFSTGEQIYVFHSTGLVNEGGGNGGLDAFWIGPDRAIGTAWANPGIDGGIWRPDFPVTPSLAADMASPLAVVTRLEGALDAFWIGADGAVATTWANPRLDNANWHPPFPITPPGAASAGSPLAAVTRLDGALDVFWIGPDGAVGTTWANPRLDNANWHPPFPVTPPRAARAGSPLVAVTRLEGALHVFWIGPDGAIATTWAIPRRDGGAWNQPFPVTPPSAARHNSPLAAITRFEGALDVFWIGPDGAVATTWANPDVDNGNWHGPFPITPPGAARVDAPLAAVTRLDGALDVFWIGPDGAVATTWANPQIDNGNWHAPFPITGPGAAAPGSPITALTRSSGPPQTLMARTVLARAIDNDPTNLQALYDVSRLDQGGRFINVACAKVNAMPDLLFAGPALLAWGSGRYRDSDVYLACVPLASVEQASSWRFFTGLDPASGRPRWSDDQRSSVPLFLHRQVGELSVSWAEPLGLWLMLYNAAAPRGINGRTAHHPWGPWSDPTIVFDPQLGYGAFMHAKGAADGLSDPGREDEWGGEYGPYIIDRYTQPVGGATVPQARIYFLLSTWNPYNTMLMTAVLQREGQ
jgi:hypothetical protein